MEIFMKRLKKDQIERGEKFEISGQKMKNGESVPEIVKWYLKDLKLKENAYVFTHMDIKGKIQEENHDQGTSWVGSQEDISSQW